MRARYGAYLLIVVGFAIAVFLQYERRFQNRTTEIEFALRQGVTHINDLVNASAAAVEAMRLQAEAGFRDPRTGLSPSPIRQMLVERPRWGGFALPSPPEGTQPDAMGSLTGKGSPTARSREWEREIDVAQGLNPLFRATLKEVPNAVWVYYTSGREIINIIPWVSDTEFHYTADLLKHEFYVNGLPGRNPQRKLFWTDAYIDLYGKGMMVTVAAPVDDELGTFRGTVALDLTLDVLSAFSRSVFNPNLPGTAVLVNASGQLLAHPSLVASSDKTVRMADAVLPRALRGAHSWPPAGEEASLRPVDGNLVLSHRIDRAPWALAYFVETSVVRGRVLARMIPEAAFFWLLLLSLFLIERHFRTSDILRKSRADLLENERRLATLLGNLPGMAYRCLNDRSWTMEFVSSGVEDLTGYRADEIVGNAGLSYSDIVHPDDRQRTWEETQRAVDAHLPFSFIYRITPAGGGVRTVWEQGRAIHSVDGRLVALEGFVLDVTERVLAEQALRESEERFAKAFHASPIAMSISNIDGGLTLDVNDEWQALTGYARKEAIGKTSGEMGCWPKDRQRATFVERLRRDGDFRDFEATLRTRDGEMRDVLLAGETIDINGEAHLLLALHDVTERKRTEDALRASEEERRAILRTAMEGIWIADMEGRLLEVNEAYCRLSGYDEAELLTMRVADVEATEAAADIIAHIQKIAAQGSLGFETLHRRKDGSLFDVEVSAQYRPTNGGRIIAFLRDITGRKKAEGQARRDMTRLRGLVRILQYRAKTVQEILDNALNEAIALTESKIGYIFFYNEDRKKFVMNTWSKEVMAECAVVDRPACYELDDTGIWGEAVRQRAPVIINDFEAYHPLRKGYPEGHVQITRFMTVPVFKDGQIVAVAGVANKDGNYDETDTLQLTLLMDTVWKSVDIKWSEEENAKLASQLQHAQKMQVVGQLAGGTAHDFNNLLQVIQANLELIALRSDEDKKIRDLVDSARAAVRRGAKLGQQLLAFSRRQTLHPETINPNDLIERTVNLLRRTLGEDVEVKTSLDGGIASISIDPDGMENALLNLAINARGAMPKGGRLTIRSANTHLDEEIVSEEGILPAGDYVEIAVLDTGSGMAPEILAHAFEPFFTTKEVGQGSGLGLSMVYGFALQSDGHVTLESEVGKGTTVRMIFPAISARLDAARETPEETTAVAGVGTILVVEDDPDVRRSVVMILDVLGYDTREAGSGAAALEILDQDAGIDLLFTDMVMPGGMSGLELAQEAVRRRANLKVLLTSGYPEKVLEKNGQAASGFSLLGKPYSNMDLHKAIKAIFAG